MTLSQGKATEYGTKQVSAGQRCLKAWQIRKNLAKQHGHKAQHLKFSHGIWPAGRPNMTAFIDLYVIQRYHKSANSTWKCVFKYQPTLQQPLSRTAKGNHKWQDIESQHRIQATVCSYHQMKLKKETAKEDKNIKRSRHSTNIITLKGLHAKKHTFPFE